MSWPKLVLLAVTAVILAVPVLVMLPLASGLMAVGRTRTFCQVSELVTAPLLALLIVKVIWLVLIEVIAAEVPLATELMFLLLLPLPPILSILTVGAVPPVSKMNPLGALRMMVVFAPPASPELNSK